MQDALLKPYHFRFGRPTSLADVKERLARDLGAIVVLDLAALDRLEIEPEDTVTLELEGVRLKTGLRLLLDQVGLTYRVVAEDNLLVLTDKEGADDPLERVMAELHELHRDVHDVQDAIDDLREVMGLVGPEGARAQADDHRRDAGEPGAETWRSPRGSTGAQARVGFEAARQPSLASAHQALRRLDFEANRPMRQGNKTTGAVSDSADALRRSSPGPSQGRQPKASQEGRSWLSEPRTAVLLILGAVVSIGGGRRLLQALRRARPWPGLRRKT